MGEVGDPQLVRAAGAEVALGEVRAAVGLRVRFRGAPRPASALGAPGFRGCASSRCTVQRATGSPARSSAFYIRR
jgi:hypothetical protein